MATWVQLSDERLGLYEICVPSEYTKKVVMDISQILELPFDKERLTHKLDNNGEQGVGSVYLVEDEKRRVLLLLECANTDWLHTLCVLYDESLHPPIYKRMAQWDRLCREEYQQPRPEGYQLRNKRMEENPLFKQIFRKHRK
ncbi:hypothetical protein [Mechercharimyces sp. CAU 1602]|uniref:hypothetical protein n=1 Tax=Mechercharimyces sp. CAU 1602 TaxID=2973933 RepID=UPI002163B5CA|nr:hypothetical protein [Mechercharimyces sp. CAU 1602]MCS1351881.1 hypothetical protein [Mechercharimyces sp. CAU 1602]